MQQFVLEAKKSLMKKIQGYDVIETKIVKIPGGEKDEDGNPKPVIKEQVTIKKHIQPDTAAIIFTLTNGDPEHWRNRQTTEVTGSDGEPLFVPKITDKMIDEDGEPFTAHTTNPVPFCVIGYDCELRDGGRLADIAPTMLQILGLEQPEEMDGKSLIK